MTQNTLRQEEPNDELLRLRQEVAEFKNALDLERASFDKRIKQAEASAKENRERLEFILQGAGIGSWEWNIQTGELKDDEYWLQLLGYRMGEIESDIQHWGAFIHPDDLPRMGKTFPAHSEGMIPFYEDEYRIRSKSGSWVCVLDKGKITTRDSSGKPLLVAGVHIDITKRRQAEEALRMSEERFKRLVQNSNDIIAVMDENGILLELSGPTEKVIGFKPEELLGTSGFTFIHPDEREATMKLFKEILQHLGNSRRAEYRYRHKNGNWVELEAAGNNLMHDPVVKGVVLNVRDISERNRLQERLQHGTKMEAIGFLAGGVAHDFNNLLNVINGYCELILEDLPADDSRRHDVEQINMAGKHAASLTSQLLAFSRKQMLQPMILDLNDAVTSMKSMLRPMIRENIDLVMITQPGLGLINADPGQIQQIVMNLAANARDAMPEEGKLIIETADVKFDEEYVREHPNVKAGSYIMLAISDNGLGMNETTRAHLFEPFYTTKGRGRGTGLGLSTVYGIVNQSNGFITVYSEPEKGTTFKIYFPRAEGEIVSVPCESKAPHGVGGMEAVLIAEDESLVRSLAVRVLSEQGYTVLEASNGIEALEIAREYAGNIHLLLTDVVMPGMSGKELASRLEAELPGIKALYVSGYTDNAIVHQGMLDSDVAFLQKPFTIEQLKQKVREVLG